jgi:hypothetical protein
MMEELAILERVIDPRTGGMSAELARHILSLDFPRADHARVAKLSGKAQKGTLTKSERAELERYLNVDDMLAMLKSKARMSLRQKSSAA